MKKCWIAVLVYVVLSSITPVESFATTYYTLTVASSNPSSGVAITVSPNDRYGRGNGTTQFTRSYASSTSVTLTAPATKSGKAFQKWKKGSSDYSTNQSVSVTVTANATMTAVYVTDTTAPTGSVNINVGAAATNSTSVTLALTCSDANGCSQMQFSNDNSTWSTAETYAATKSWTLASGDGTKTVYAKFKDAVGNWSSAVSDTITLDATAPTTTATPAGGTFTGSVTVALSAGEAATTYYCTGIGCSPTTTYTSPLTFTAATTLRYYSQDTLGNSEVVKEAVYTPPFTVTINYSGQNCNGCSGANISISPADINGHGDGVSAGYYTLTRTYTSGTSVTLTAPERVASDGFQYWTTQGGIMACNGWWCFGNVTDRTITFTLTSDGMVTAVYAPTPVNVSLASSNPTSGASIRVKTSPLDNGSIVTTTANPVTLAYTSANTIYLTALLTSSDGHSFLKWQKNGADFATTASISLQLTANAVMTAVYATPTVPIYTLTATSSTPWNDGQIYLVQNGDFGIYLDNTQPTRKYPAGTELFLQAGSNSGNTGGSDFQKWVINGVDYPGTVLKAVRVTMNADTAMTAVWGPKLCKLTTVSTVGLWGLTKGPAPRVTVSPSDDGHGGNGYDCGTTVTLSTVWSECNNTFSHWAKFYSGGLGSLPIGELPDRNTTISLTLNDPMTYIGPVYYKNLGKLYIASTNPDSEITIPVTTCYLGSCVTTNVWTAGLPVDFWGTFVNNDYWCGYQASVAAPATSSDGHVFQKWLMNGRDYTTTPATAIETGSHNTTMTAVYSTPATTTYTLTLISSNPDTNVNIAVSPKDAAWQANGATPLTRTYNIGSVVTLAAPVRAGSNIFKKWQKNGADYATTQAAAVTMDDDTTMTAVYDAATNAHASLTWTGNATGYAICQQCHMDRVNEMFNSLHYQMMGSAAKMANGATRPQQGKLDKDAGGTLLAGKSAVNAFCINMLGNFDNLGACSPCHVGRGARPSPQISQQQLDNIDCLLCHQKAYKRKKDTGTGTYIPDAANMSITMDQTIQTVHKPERANCLQCHAKAGGGDAVKRGDLAMASGATADRHYDVHMATTGANLQCQSCHNTMNHKIPGRGSDLRPLDTDTAVSCSTSACHPAKSTATGHATLAVGRHVNKVACQTCHIPVFAKDASDTVSSPTSTEATEMNRDWRVAEWSIANNRYEAYRDTANNVTPVYKWFDGTSWGYNLLDPVSKYDDNGAIVISMPQPGDFFSQESPNKLTPFKYKTAWQPITAWGSGDFLIPLSTSKYFAGPDNYDAAVTEGLVNAGYPATTPYATVQTSELLMLNHQVSPAADSVLQCASCHTIQGVPGSQINLRTLMNSDKADVICSTCHSEDVFPRGGDWLRFHKILNNGSTMMRYGCAYCHGQ